MQSRVEINKMTRRAFGALVAIAVAGGTQIMGGRGATPVLATDVSMVPVYAFRPVEKGKVTACKACHRHAANKLFATLQAADANRAHAGCDCLIQTHSVSAEDYVRMFGGPVNAPYRVDYDVRWPALPKSPPKTTVGGLEMPVARIW